MRYSQSATVPGTTMYCVPARARQVRLLRELTNNALAPKSARRSARSLSATSSIVDASLARGFR